MQTNGTPTLEQPARLRTIRVVLERATSDLEEVMAATEGELRDRLDEIWGLVALAEDLVRAEEAT